MMEHPGVVFWLAQHLMITTVLAGVVLAGCRLFRLSPAARHMLWLLVLCRLLIPSVAVRPWPLPIDARPAGDTASEGDSMTQSAARGTYPGGDLAAWAIVPETAFTETTGDASKSPVAPVGRSRNAESTLSGATGRGGASWIWLAAVVWFLGSVIVGAVLIRRIRRVGRLLSVENRDDTWVRQDVAHWCGLLALRAPECVVSGRFPAPFVWCLGRVWLVWPASLSRPEHRAQARPILVHELAHLKRRDHWTAWIELAGLAVWWWNPLFWFVRRQLRTASEMACDAWVVELLPEERRAYAESLVQFSRPWPKRRVPIGVVGADSGSRRAFTRRLEMIMNEQVSARFSRLTLVLAVLLGLISLPVFSTERDPTDDGAARTTAADAAEDADQAVGTNPPAAQPDSAPSAVEPAADDAGTEDGAESTVSLNEVLERIADSYYGDVDRGALERAAVEAILSSLDGNSQLLSREEFNEAMVAVEGELVGVGVAFNIDSGTQLPVVTRTLRHTPAHAAGIQAGDVILDIDGATTAGRELNDLVRQLRGPRGSRVLVRIQRGDVTREFEIVRDNLAFSRVEPWSVSAEGEESFWIDPAAKIGYAHVPAFTRQTAAQLRQVLTELTADGARGLVLDLRNCPGGLLTAATETVDLFIEEGVIVTSRGRNEGDMTIRATPDGTFVNLRVAVLVNVRTASAAEITAACLQDHHRAAVVGERTFGRGTVQSLFPLDDGGALKLTTAAWLRPNGRPLQRGAGEDDWGVDPDEGLIVPLSDEARQRVDDLHRQRLDGLAIDPEDDPQLKIALDWLQPG